MKVLVCGGRGYKDYRKVQKTLNAIHKKTPIVMVIEGGAKGADQCARIWSKLYDIEVHVTIRARWKTLKKAAGPIRNSKMLKLKPDLVVAFPGGNGTANVVKLARKVGVEVREIA